MVYQMKTSSGITIATQGSYDGIGTRSYARHRQRESERAVELGGGKFDSYWERHSIVRKDYILNFISNDIGVGRFVIHRRR